MTDPGMVQIQYTDCILPCITHTHSSVLPLKICIFIFPSKIWAKSAHDTQQNTVLPTFSSCQPLAHLRSLGGMPSSHLHLATPLFPSEPAHIVLPGPACLPAPSTLRHTLSTPFWHLCTHPLQPFPHSIVTVPCRPMPNLIVNPSEG